MIGSNVPGDLLKQSLPVVGLQEACLVLRGLQGALCVEACVVPWSELVRAVSMYVSTCRHGHMTAESRTTGEGYGEAAERGGQGAQGGAGVVPCPQQETGKPAEQ